MHIRPITPYKDYKIWLQSELMRRCHDNPKYSLRAFAASLKLSPSFLSKVLSGKRSLTLKTANKILPSLDLSPQEKESFLHLVFEDRQTSTPSPKQGQVEDYALLTIDAFSIILNFFIVFWGRGSLFWLMAIVIDVKSLSKTSSSLSERNAISRVC